MAGAIARASVTLCFSSQNPIKTLPFSIKTHSFHFPRPKVSALRWNSVRTFSPRHGFSNNTTHYEFSDGSSEVELRLQLGSQDVLSAKDIFVDADGTFLTVKLRQAGSFITLIDTKCLFEKIRPAETIWYIDDDQLVINLKKQDPELKWPDIMESWESLSAASMQLLKGTSIFIVGDSTEINQKVARKLAVALGYTPLDTKELLESFAKQTIDSWVLAEGSDSVAEAESAILESLSSHVRAVVATLGGSHGAAERTDKWRHLYSGFTVWLSQTEAIDESSAKEEARRHIEDGKLGYSNADVVVKLQGWDADHAKSVAQASLSALKQLILSDKKLPGIGRIGRNVISFHLHRPANVPRTVQIVTLFSARPIQQAEVVLRDWHGIIEYRMTSIIL